MAGHDASGPADTTVEGVFFAIEELERLRALALNGITVEIDGIPPPAYEERVLFRLRWAPHLVAAALHKRSDGDMVLTGNEIGTEGSVPVIEATFGDLDAAIFALGEIFRA